MFDVVVYTRDRHPAEHCSFKEQGGDWPAHCVDGTEGFKWHPQLLVLDDAIIIDKATKPDRDAYSGFDDTGLAKALKERNIGRCVVAGLATDYCVKATVLDAIQSGFETWLMTDAIAAVNVQPGDDTKAILEMREAGTQLAESGAVMNLLKHHPAPTALIVVDVQKDFCKGGTLAVPGSETILGPLEKLLRLERDD